MQPLVTYDYLARARQRLFEWTRPLGVEPYTQEFSIGPGTLGRTLTHIMVSEWYYVQRIGGRDVPAYEDWPIRQETPPPFGALESAWARQADETRATLAGVRDWGADLEYGVTEDDGRAVVVTASAGGLFTQLVLHEVHHRAQALNMLRHLAVAVDDLDFNELMFDRRDASG